MPGGRARRDEIIGINIRGHDLNDFRGLVSIEVVEDVGKLPRRQFIIVDGGRPADSDDSWCYRGS